MFKIWIIQSEAI